MTTEFKHLKRWTYPDYYMGDDRSDWYCGTTYLPLQDNLIAESNYTVFLNELSYFCFSKGYNLSEHTEETVFNGNGYDFYQLVEETVFNHFLVGYYKQVQISIAAPPELLEFADSLLQKIEDNIILDEDHYNDMLYEAVMEYWGNSNQVFTANEAMLYFRSDYRYSDDYDFEGEDIPELVYDYIMNMLER